MTNPLFGRQFSKLQACGNTAIVVKGIDISPTAEQVRSILTGEGDSRADNLLLYATGGCPGGLDIVVRGYNSDGSRVGLCGNGARCLTWFAARSGEISNDEQSYEMLMDSSRVTTKIEDLEMGIVSLLVPPPSFDPQTIPFNGDASSGRISVCGNDYEYVVVNLGNPHCVLFIEGEPLSPVVEAIGIELNDNRELFPDRINVSLASIDRTSIDNPGRINALIYERGVGLSPSSGTGTIAIATAARSFKGLGSTIEVCMPGGCQTVHWLGGATEVSARTPVQLVCEGVLGETGITKSRVVNA